MNQDKIFKLYEEMEKHQEKCEQCQGCDQEAEGDAGPCSKGKKLLEKFNKLEEQQAKESE